MPELPDVVIYLEALADRILDRRLERVSIRSPFLIRTYQPSIESTEGRRLVALDRFGKRLVFEFEEERFWVLHLMIAGRLKWREPGQKPLASKIVLATFEFETGVLQLTEAGSKKRASLHVFDGRDGLDAHRREGLEVSTLTVEEVRDAAKRHSHTLKRFLGHPSIFSGIGNAYGDEILHRACLSPVTLCGKLSDEEIERLHGAIVEVMEEWTALLRKQAKGRFPEKVTAFRPEMAVHGKFGEPCPRCGTKVQRIVYADRETNYCPRCQTGGKLLRDRALSRILREDWPATIEEEEAS